MLPSLSSPSRQCAVLGKLYKLILPNVTLAGFPRFSLCSLLPIRAADTVPATKINHVVVYGASLSATSFTRSSYCYSVSISPSSSSPVQRRGRTSFPSLLRTKALSRVRMGWYLWLELCGRWSVCQLFLWSTMVLRCRGGAEGGGGLGCVNCRACGCFGNYFPLPLRPSKGPNAGRSRGCKAIGSSAKVKRSIPRGQRNRS